MKRSISSIVSMLLACALLLPLVGCGGTPVLSSTSSSLSVIQSAPSENLPDASEPDEDASQFCVLIDPGHQLKENPAQEPIGPNAFKTKAMVSSGTVGRFSGVPEYEVTLQVGLLLKDELEQRNFRVVMTRTDHNVNISNAQRAQMADEVGADIIVRIHANGSDDPTVHGAMTICMTRNNPYCAHLYPDSRLLSNCILDQMTSATGSARRDVWETDTMTGINWASVPVTIVEMGYMTNQEEDLLLTNPDFQKKLAYGMANGIEEYFRLPPPDESDFPEPTQPATPVTPETPEPPVQTETPEPPKQSQPTEQPPSESNQTLKQVITNSLSGRTDMWDVWCERLSDGSVTSVQLNGAGNGRMVAASLIKIFVMGAVFEAISQGKIDLAAVRPDLESMIQVSDNSSTNRLIRRLGNGDADAGMAVVNDFTRRIGCNNTSLNRLMLADNGLQNYTTAEDCATILRLIYQGRCVSPEWSAEMLTILKGQQKNTKIPGLLPKGTAVAHKTGTLTQLSSGDVGIVFSPAGDYIICIINNKSKNDAKTEKAIATLSLDVYQHFNP